MAAPVLTAVLYLLIFGHVLEDHVKVYDRISYTAFLVPGLDDERAANAFANSSSSIIQSKIMGSLVFVLLTPLSHWAWFVPMWAVGRARAGGGPGRVHRHAGVCTAGVCGAAVGPGVCLLGAALLATLGLIAGLWADKFDQMAAFQNFIIVPMTFLSGVFYPSSRCRRSGRP